MYRYAVKNCFCRSGIEVFVFKFSERSAVYCVRIIGIKFFNIKVICSSAYLLVGSKAYFDISVRCITFDNSFNRRDDCANSRLVVRTKQSRSVGDNETIAYIIIKRRIVTFFEIDAFLSVKANIFTRVFNNACFDRGVGAGIACVNMGNQSEPYRRVVGV